MDLKNPDAIGEVVQIFGDGQLCIKSVDGSGKHQDNVLVDIKIKKNNNNGPIYLFLSGGQTIYKDEDIRLVYHEITKDDLNTVLRTDASELNDLNRSSSTVDEKETAKDNVRHRRMPSDFLIIRNIETCASVEGNMDIPKHSPNEGASANIPQENSASFSDCSKPSGGFSDSSVTSNSRDMGAKKMAVWRHFIGNGNNATPGDKKDYHHGVSDNVRQEKSEEESGVCQERSDEQSGVRLKFSIYKSLQGLGKSKLSLQEAIRKSFTFLLQELDISKLCDNLYEKYVLDLDSYKELFDMWLEQSSVTNAKRLLLYNLSTRTVERENFIEALFGAAQDKLIPRFYPDGI